MRGELVKKPRVGGPRYAQHVSAHVATLNHRFVYRRLAWRPVSSLKLPPQRTLNWWPVWTGLGPKRKTTKPPVPPETMFELANLDGGWDFRPCPDWKVVFWTGQSELS